MHMNGLVVSLFYSLVIFFQYPPVMGTSLYMSITSHGKNSEDTFKKWLGRLAWKTVDTVKELIDQHWMKSDSAYANTVLQLWTCNCNFEDVKLFNSRLITSADNPDGVNMSTIENEQAAVIVQTNALWELLNFAKAKSNCRHTDDLILCAAKDISNDLPNSLTLEDCQNLLHLDFVSSKKFQQSLPGFLPFSVLKSSCSNWKKPEKNQTATGFFATSSCNFHFRK